MRKVFAGFLYGFGPEDRCSITDLDPVFAAAFKRRFSAVVYLNIADSLIGAL